MAETSLNPADLIAERGAALTVKLVDVARQVVADALDAGKPVTAADVLAQLESLTDTLPGALVATIIAELPQIAADAVTRAEVEIADAREASGKGFPAVPPPQAGDYLGWAATVTAALIAAAKRDISTAPDMPVAEASKAATDAAADASHFDIIAETAAARTVNDARLNTFKANDDIVNKVKVITVHDQKRSEICTHLSGAEFDISRGNIPTPPYHNGCRSHLAAMTDIRRKAGATDKEIERQNWAIFRRLQREAKAASPNEGRAEERLEVRFAPTLGEAGTFSGYASVWGELDRHGTAFAKGAFAASLAEQRTAGHRLPMLWNHDPDALIGSWEATEEDGHGLKVAGRIVTETRAGAEAYALLKAGSLNGLSVGFRRLRDEPRSGGGRMIIAAELAEISLVGIPSSKSARVTEVRGLPAAGAAIKQKERAMPLDNTKTAPADTGNTEDLASRVEALEGKVDDIAASVDEIKAAVTKTEARADKIEARSARNGLGGGDKPTGELERRAFGSYLRSGDRAPAEELRALVVSSDPQGGYLAPPEISNEFIRDLVEFSPIRALATVRQTASPSVKYPRRTGVTNAQWEGEGDDQAESTVPFGQVDIPARSISTFVDISNQLLADSGGTADAEVRRALAEDFGQKEGLSFVAGNTNLQPEGLLTAAGVAHTPSGNASTLGSAPADLLITAMYALPAAYRARGTWLMNGSTLASIRKLKDGTTGNYLWQPAYAAGQPETILGRPVVEVVDMDDIGSGATPILFGDIATAYRIVDRLDMSILVNPYLLATKGITRIHATRRVGGAVVQPAALRKIKCATS